MSLPRALKPTVYSVLHEDFTMEETEKNPVAAEKPINAWLSFEREIKNPYFGSEMLNCGSVEDSLDYSKK